MRARSIAAAPDTISNLTRRFLPVAIFFAIAFAADMLSGQRYSSVWGSAAIVGSVVHLFPSARPTLAALGGYAALWVGFNVIRAIGDDAGMAIAGSRTVSRLEGWVFGRTLPSKWLQIRFFDPSQVQVHDVALSIVHGSFFVVPFLVAILVWWRIRRLFHPYAMGTAVTFLFGLVGFVLLPTAPPWMSNPWEVTRVTRHVLVRTTGIPTGGDQDAVMASAFRFEPNHLAAMPSIHVSVIVIVFLLLKRIGPLSGVIGGIYALFMTLGVVYLGEHFVLDAILGWVIALAGWTIACRWSGEDEHNTATLSRQHHSGVPSDTNNCRRYRNSKVGDGTNL